MVALRGSPLSIDFYRLRQLCFCFFAFSSLYLWGNREIYGSILIYQGVVPQRMPFVDLSYLLASWECTRQGWDVIATKPCDILGRPLDYSPVWLSLAPIPLGLADTPVVGGIADLLFLISLFFLPPARKAGEMLFILLAMLSSTVTYGLERANFDVVLFAVTVGMCWLLESRFRTRLVGYLLALVGTFLKYYPIMLLIFVLRERPRRFWAVGAAALAALAAFWFGYHSEIIRALRNVPSAPYMGWAFGAKNLPFETASLIRKLPLPKGALAPMQRAAAVALYLGLLGASMVICRRELRRGGLHQTFAALTSHRRIFLVAGSAVIVGCFFASQNIYYRAVFLLLTLPGFLTASRIASSRRVQRICLAASSVIVFLMWEECFRWRIYVELFVNRAVPPIVFADLYSVFWVVRELAWWWVVTIMLTVLADFIHQAPVMLHLSHAVRGRRGRAFDPDPSA